ncbi:chemotaxis protein CheW [Thiobacter aerophilum]|uniref:Chemotaxis protein CheW n=1 Tax=Thiobacter aerophilum TaxID=3121275 RepID=A0ABV0EG66_9BURK
MARKTSLREFQESVVARLQNAAAGGAAAVASKVGVLVGQERWLVNLGDVSEVIPVPPLLAVPLTKRWFLGVANVRGVLYGVVDWADYLYGQPNAAGLDSRLLLIHPRHGVNAGLLVRQMLGLKTPDQLTASQTDGLPPGVAAEYVDADGQVWKELSMQALVNQAEFLNVGR